MLRGLSFSHTPHVVGEGRRRREHPSLREKRRPVPARPPIVDDADTGAGGPRRSRSPDSQRQARIPSAESTLRRLNQRTSAVVCPSTIPPVFYEELRLALCLTPGKQTQRRGTLPRHTPQRVRNERHDDVHILRPGVLEALELSPLAQLISLIDTPLIPVYCIPDEGVRQRNVSEDRSHPPKVLVIRSVKDVAYSASRVQFTREAVFLCLTVPERIENGQTQKNAWSTLTLFLSDDQFSSSEIPPFT